MILNMTRKVYAVGAAIIGLALPGVRDASGKGTPMLPVGEQAPDLEGYDVNGKSLKLSAVRGHQAIVYFYPKDDTPGCTKEACAFRDSMEDYKKAGIEVFGVSRDSRESHVKFQTKYRLPFWLVPDTEGVVQKAYGVSSTFGMVARVSFLVGADGKIKKVWPNVDPSVHAADVLKAAVGN